MLPIIFEVVDGHVFFLMGNPSADSQTSDSLVVYPLFVLRNCLLSNDVKVNGVSMC
jgi:hypothetical protein